MIIDPIFISPNAEAPEDAEYAVFRSKLNDPLYLNKFYCENAELLKAQFWRNVSRNRFVIDTRKYWPDYFADFTKIFEPLSEKDAAIRSRNENRRGPHQLLRLKSNLDTFKTGCLLDYMLLK